MFKYSSLSLNWDISQRSPRNKHELAFLTTCSAVPYQMTKLDDISSPETVFLQQGNSTTSKLPSQWYLPPTFPCTAKVPGWCEMILQVLHLELQVFMPAKASPLKPGKRTVGKLFSATCFTETWVLLCHFRSLPLYSQTSVALCEIFSTLKS